MPTTMRQQWDNTNLVSLTSTYRYDSYGNRTHRISPAGNAPGINNPDDYAYVNVYDPSHTFVQSHTTPADENGIKLTTRDVYDPRFGKHTTRTDANGQTTKWQYDDLGRLIGKKRPDPSGKSVPVMTHQWQSDNKGTLQKSRHRVGWDGDSPFAWRKVYVDGLRRNYRVQASAPPDSGGQPIESSTQYHTATLIKARSYPRFENDETYFQTIEYDAYGRRIQHQQPYKGGAGGATATITKWDYPDRDAITETRAYGTAKEYTKTTKFEYFNGKRKTVQMVVPGDKDATTTYSYDRLGRLTDVVDPIGVSTSIGYDSLGRRCFTAETNIGTTKFIYDTQGRFHQQVSINDISDESARCGNGSPSTNSRAITFSYDKLGRKISRTTAERTVKYYYENVIPPAIGTDYPNTLGKLATVEIIPRKTTSSKTRYDYGYHPDGVRGKRTLTLNEVPYTSSTLHTPFKQLRTHSYADGSLATYNYDPSGYLSTIELFDKPSDTTRTYADYKNYSATGIALEMDYGEGIVSVQYGLHPWGTQHTSKITVTGQAEPLLDLEYKLNPLSLIHQIIDNNAKQSGDTSDTDYSQTFVYDNLRLQTASSELYGQLSFGYDQAGNILSKDGYTYTYAPKTHQLTGGTHPDGDSFKLPQYQYGNLTEKTVTESGNTKHWLYAYDTEDNLTAVNANEKEVYSFAYNHRHRRLSKTNNSSGVTTLYVAPTLELKRKKGAPVDYTKFIYGPEGRVASVTTKGSPAVPVKILDPSVTYRHKDEVSSNTIVTDGKGKLVSRLAYKPYGSLLSLSQNGDAIERKFGSKELDQASGSYYFGARYYDPIIGRFISADDRLGASRYRQDAYNRYAFVLNNPRNFRDPTGHVPCIGGLVFGGISGVLGGVGIALGEEIKHQEANSSEPTALGKAVEGVGIASLVAGSVSFIWGAAECGVAIADRMAERKVLRQQARDGNGNDDNDSGNDASDSNDSDTELEQVDNNNNAADCSKSFIGQTLVAVEGGRRPIKEVVTDDIVWAFDENSGQKVLQPVSATHRRVAPELLRLSIGGENMGVTPEHPFLVVGKGWTNAGDLQLEDLVVTRKRGNLPVDAIRVEQGDVQVFNLSVATAETFYVSEKGILVHNDCTLDEQSESESGDAADTSAEGASDANSGAETVGSSSADAGSSASEGAEAGAEAGEAAAEGAESVGDVILDVFESILEFFAALF